MTAHVDFLLNMHVRNVVAMPHDTLAFGSCCEAQTSLLYMYKACLSFEGAHDGH
jgi:hypothetical protein